MASWIERDPALLAGPLLLWYDQNARRLPWRSFPSPYRVWVSEIMLQQTRVDTALPYFERFVAALPDIAALACTDESALLKLWEGLGYYSRVRNMQKAARTVMDKHGGKLPGTAEELRTLPGIGDYTAGAIASIAFGRREEAVDGNVMRVLSRLTASREDVSLPETRKSLRALARSLLPEDRPGDFNQALMDLGATVCLPNGEPLCAACPLPRLCEGYTLGVAAGLPLKSAAKPREKRDITVFVVLSEGKVLLRLRPPGGLLAGLWELPGREGLLDEAQARDALAGWSLPLESLVRIDDARHIFTHVEWQLRGWLARTASQSLPGENFAWADAEALRAAFAMPGAFKAYRKYLPGANEGGAT